MSTARPCSHCRVLTAAGERSACVARVRRLLDLHNVMRSLDAGEVVSAYDIELDV